MTKKHFSSQSTLAQGGSNKYIQDASIIPPVYTSTTYLRDSDNQYRSGRVYSRADNPTYRPAEQLLAELENAIADKQMEGGFGDMLSIRLAGGEKAAIAEDLLKDLQQAIDKAQVKY